MAFVFIDIVFVPLIISLVINNFINKKAVAFFYFHSKFEHKSLNLYLSTPLLLQLFYLYNKE